MAETMQQLTLTEQRDLRRLEVPAPSIEAPNEALVRPIAVALCDLDRLIISGELPLPTPIAIGHEAIAEIVELGEDVNGLAVGDRVIVPFQINCGRCERCLAGATGSCKGVQRGSMYGFGVLGGDWGGALSDLIRVPFAEAMLIQLPEGLDPVRVASLPDNVPDGWRTVGPQLRMTPGAEVAIVAGGAPSIGLYAAQFAQALGASRVVYYDSDPDRGALAERIGAEVVADRPERPAERHPITVDATGTTDGLIFALRATEPQGTCTCVASFEEAAALPMREMYARGVSLSIGRVMARAVLPEVLDLVASGSVDPGLVNSRVVGWEEAAEALPEEQTKLVVRR